MNKSAAIFESDIEEFVIELLLSQGWEYLPPEAQEAERADFSQAVLKNRLKLMIEELNPQVNPEAREQAMRLVLNLPSQNLIANNQAFHQMLTDGVKVEYRGPDGIRGELVRLGGF